MGTKRSGKLSRFAFFLLLIIISVVIIRIYDTLLSLADPTDETTQTHGGIPTDLENPQDWETPLMYYTQTDDENRNGTAQTSYTSWYDRNKNIGTCAELNDHVLVYFVFVSEPNLHWSEAQKAHLRSKAYEELRIMENEAATEGVSLVVSKTETDIVCQRTLAWNDRDMNDTCDYVMSLLLSESDSATYRSMYQNILRSNGADSAAFLLFSLADGRGYAHIDSIRASEICEHAVCFGEECTGFLHELMHLYGAVDFYYPEKVRVEAKQTFGDSVMLNQGKIDDFTKYLIGWDQTPSETAQSFLDAVSSVTKEDVCQAAALEWEADYVERNYDDGSVYMGPIHKGRQNGTGKLIQPDGSVYEGSFVDGKLNGHGKIVYPDGSVYEGNFVDGKYSGQGRYTTKNGSVYEGAFANGQFNGYGKMLYYDGSVYEGYYSNGQYSGQGKLTYRTGDVYQGSFVNGKCSGQGRLVYRNGNVYEGSFANGQCSGQGRLTYRNGDVYQGSFSDGLSNGQGTIKYSSGSVYQGSFVNGQRSGQGRLTYYNGDVYEGNFAGGQFSGLGRYTSIDGSVYEGEFSNSQYNGKGILRYSNGSVYEGSFVGGKCNGYGKLTYRDGSVCEGYFVNNTLVR